MVDDSDLRLVNKRDPFSALADDLVDFQSRLLHASRPDLHPPAPRSMSDDEVTHRIAVAARGKALPASFTMVCPLCDGSLLVDISADRSLSTCCATIGCRL